ncbi:MAG: aldehyde dehydrogenase family protein [Rhodococcus sp. (in: high G+C Gram-positive bacteria)]
MTTVTVRHQLSTPSWTLDRQFIDGQWRDGTSGDTLTVRDPFTGAVLTSLTQASLDDLDDAYCAAAAAQVEWAATSPTERRRVLLRVAQILEERRDEITSWLTAESGSTAVKAGLEVSAAAGITVESASFAHRVHGKIFESDIPDKENRVYRRPVGVVGVISPWNFPLHLTQRSIAPAIALGNSVVIKPASDTPVTGGLILANIFAEAGLPAGVLNVVVGAGSVIGDEFVKHPVPSFISFTGSTSVGRSVGRLATGGAHLKRVALELGGNSPFVVLDDADLDSAVNAAVVGKFLHQGQICMAVNRIIVDDTVHDEFLARFAERVRGLPCGDPADPHTVVGPIINAAQLKDLLGQVATAQREGATTVVEGSVDGQVLSPYVFADVTADMEIARGEIFGPLVGILRARDEAHALELANDVDFGLSSSVFTADLDRGVRFARRIESGMAHVNDIPVNDEAHVAFGGEKNSGLGRFNGDWAIEDFTTDQWISVQRRPRHYPF